MERVYPLNYLKQLSNCSPVSSENIPLVKLLHKTISAQAVTAALVFPLFISTFPESGPLVRDEAAGLCLQLVLPEGKTEVSGREVGTPWQLFWRCQIDVWTALADGDINPYRNLSGHGVCWR